MGSTGAPQPYGGGWWRARRPRYTLDAELKPEPEPARGGLRKAGSRGGSGRAQRGA